MRRLLFIWVLLLTSITQTFAQTDFRKGSWGDSEAEIIQKEGIKNISSEAGIYGFESSIGGKECIAGYVFTDDKLFRGAYIFTSKYYDGKEYIRDYDYLKKLLTMKYEEPYEDEMEWASETWKNKPDHYGSALILGDVSYHSYWRTDRTVIALTMATESGNVTIRIFYDGIELSEKHTDKILEDL